MESSVFSRCLLFMIISSCFNGLFCLGSGEETNYVIGVGSYDITGPAADVVMMGYGNVFEQRAAGIHFRLRARAFIVAEEETDESGGNRLVFVNMDACMASQLVTIQVLQRLKNRYGDLYNEKNVAISGIHTHSGPGGYFQYKFYSLATLGFLNQSLNAIVDGVEQSIVKAHENLTPGSIYVNTGELLDAGISRSPSAYLRNPPEEQAKYKHNVDTDMTLLKFVDSHSVPIGSFNWFPTHGTSMSRHNTLVSGDNKGAAARFMEDWYMQQVHNYSSSTQNPSTASNPSSSIQSQKTKSSIKSVGATITKTGGTQCDKSSSTKYRVRNSVKTATFVAAFCQSNVGDVSPNVKGAFCADTGLPCDFNTSTCNGDNQLCIGQGPGYPNDFESTRMIADTQSKQAIDLFTSAKEKLSGRIDHRHVYLNFTNIPVNLTDNQEQMVTTCPAALGPGFAAGTTDGPGFSDFKQGDTEISEKWRKIRDALKKPTKEQINCQKPKAVLLDTGEMFDSIPWAPAILPIQILRIGQFIILSVPGEFTTMAGRRLREAIKETLIANGNGEYNDNIHIVIAGLTNTYSQYITTYEEYQVQRYEVDLSLSLLTLRFTMMELPLCMVHTLYLPISKNSESWQAMAKGNSIPDNGQSPPDLLADQDDILGPVSPDQIPSSASFGDVKEDVSNTSYKIGDTVSASFWSGNPRNDLLTEGTFSVVEFYDGSGKWIPAYDDDDFNVFFKWAQQNDTFYGVATIQWLVPDSEVIGTYRIRHFGAASIEGQHPVIQYFTGISSTFSISK